MCSCVEQNLDQADQVPDLLGLFDIPSTIRTGGVSFIYNVKKGVKKFGCSTL